MRLEDLQVGQVTNRGMIQTIAEIGSSLRVGFSRPEIGSYDINVRVITADNVNEL